MVAPSGTSGPAYRVKSTSSVKSEYGYPRGHLGNLSENEEEALHRFQIFLEEKGAYRPGAPPSHDDATLLRFLRARRWVVEDAYKQFKDTEDWRAANHLDVLYQTIDIGAYDHCRRLYPQWTGRRDRRGIPLYLFEIKHLDSKTIHAYESSANDAYSKAHADGKTPPKLLRLFALYENLTRFAQPLCTELTDRENARTPITLSTNIVDVSGVSLRQFWNLKSHMQAASTLATAHYPETLDRIFIIGAPVFFSTVWSWIKRWFDPITVSKIFILSSSEVKPTLEAFIDPKNIPRQYGGQLDFKWGDQPNLDPVVRDLATWESGHSGFPDGPLYWVPVDGGKRLECVAVGSVSQKERHERVCSIPRAFPEEQILQLAPESVANGQVVEPAMAAAGDTNLNDKTVEPAETTAVEVTNGAAIVPNSATEAHKAGQTEPAPEPAAPSTTTPESQEEPAVADGVKGAEVPAVSAVEGNALPVTDVQGVQNVAVVGGAIPVPKEASDMSEKSIAPDSAPSAQAAVA